MAEQAATAAAAAGGLRLDHVAIGVASVDEAVAALCGRIGLREGRRGTRTGTGEAMAFVHDDRSGTLLELVETGPTERGLLHLAFRVDGAGDVDAALGALVAGGAVEVTPPFHLAPARARTGVVDVPGLDALVQLIAYEPGAPEASGP